MKELALKVIDISNLLLISGIFIYAGIMKLLDFSAFPEEISRYHIIPADLVLYVATYLVFFEIFAAIALLIPTFRVCGAWCMFFLMAVFCVAIIFALARGIDITCGCFGSNSSGFFGKGFAFLFRDLLLLIMTIRLVCFAHSLEKSKEIRV